MSNPPKLPPELECTIFEIAALARPKMIPSLILVAHRVKHWVEPLLYRVIMVVPPNEALEFDTLQFPLFTFEILFKVIATKPLEFLQNAVRYLYIDGPVESAELQSICTACKHVVSLFHYEGPRARLVPELLDNLQHLRYLALSFDILRDCHTGRQTSCVSHITRLELFDTQEDPWVDDLCRYLPLMTCLTHIAFDSVLHDQPVQTALLATKNLRCILLLVNADYVSQRLRNLDPLLLEDDRFLCLGQAQDWREEWLQGAAMGENFWAVADSFLVARRNGKVDRSRFTISDTDTSWRD
ncbi:hypothetical protein DFH08DRAFT_246882 [Mycena albidolilacea]|uniref:Uncharacterized protein n=1 Tax=Mycena albidolilacea TaxID=1033008 RepID=A0AAD6ZV72_9AGAR|nr:hypothetical protein DFH08DRAFT_246882 [Mycena albidolilacea]